MKAKPQFVSILTAACVSVFFSLPAFAHSTNPPQDQSTTQTRSAPQDKKQPDKNQKGAGPGKDVGKGSEDVGKGAGKGAESLGKGTGEGAGNLVTGHPAKAGADLGKGAAGAGKDVGVGTGKGAAKIGEGSAKGVGKLGHKIFHRGAKNKEKTKDKEKPAA